MYCPDARLHPNPLLTLTPAHPQSLTRTQQNIVNAVNADAPNSLPALRVP